MKHLKELKARAESYNKLIETFESISVPEDAPTINHNGQEYLMISREGMDTLLNTTMKLALDVFKSIDMIEEYIETQIVK